MNGTKKEAVNVIPEGKAEEVYTSRKEKGFREKKILIKVLTNVQKACQEENWHFRKNQRVYAYQSLLGPWTVSRQCS